MIKPHIYKKFGAWRCVGGGFYVGRANTVKVAYELWLSAILFERTRRELFEK